MRSQRSDAETREQHRPGDDPGPGARVERADHHNNPGEQREKANLDNPPRRRVGKYPRDTGGGQQQRDRKRQEPDARLDRRQPERHGQEQGNGKEQPRLQQILEEERGQTAAERRDS